MEGLYSYNKRTVYIFYERNEWDFPVIIKGVRPYGERSSKVEDARIIALLNERDEKAISVLMDKYGGLCRSLISGILKDRRDAEECLNTVFMKLWTSIPPARPNDLAAYIAKTARNEALMRYRRNKAARIGSEVPIDELELFIPSGEIPGEDGGLVSSIGEFLKKQPELHRYAFMRRYWFFDTVKEIAQKCGSSESRIASMLFRMRNALRKYLEKEGYFDDRQG